MKEVELDNAGLNEVIREAGGGEEGLYVIGVPERRVSFGRRDENREGFSEACRVSRRKGYCVKVRGVGGGPVVHDGDTLGFLAVYPVEDSKTGIKERYIAVIEALEDKLKETDPSIKIGEPSESFCPGEYSLSNSSGKIAGTAQRVSEDAAAVSGVINLDLATEVPETYREIYTALDYPLDIDSVGRLDADENEVRSYVKNALSAAEEEIGVKDNMTAEDER